MVLPINSSIVFYKSQELLTRLEKSPFIILNVGLFAVFAGGRAVFFFEAAGEIKLVAKAEFLADFEN